MISSGEMDTEYLKMVNEIGSDMMGPYPCGDSVQFEIHAMGYNMNTLMSSSIYKMECGTTSTTEIELSSWSVFPNPAQSQFQISGLKENDRVTVFDMQGKLIETWTNVSNSNMTINTENWSSGLYNVQVQNGNKTSQTKLQVVH